MTNKHCETCNQPLEFEHCRDCRGWGVQRSPRIYSRNFVQVICQWCEGESGFWICPNAENHKPDQAMCDYDFSGMTDLDLVRLQSETRKSPYPEDKEFLNAILKELGERQGKT